MEMNKKMASVFTELLEQEIGPVVGEMAECVGDALDMSAEFVFENGEEEIIVDLAESLYKEGAYEKGIYFLFLPFSLTENTEALTILDVLLGSQNETIQKLFLEYFLTRYRKQLPEVLIPLGKLN